MKTFLATIGCLLALTAAAPAPAQVTTKGAKTLLRIKWVKGKTYRYSINFAMLMPGSSKPMNSPMSLKMDVTDAKAGVGTIKYSLVGAQGLDDKPQTVKLDARGKALSASGLGDLLIALPANALKVGESWTLDQPATNSMFGKASISMKLTFRGVKTIKGKKVAEMNLATTMKGKGTSGKGQGLLYVTVDDGMVSSMDQMLNVQSKSTDSKGKTQVMELPVHITMALQ